MKRFSSDQVRPFRYVLTETGSPFPIVALRKGDTFAYEVDSAEWKFLESIMAQPPELLHPDGSRRSEFWARLLDYGRYSAAGEGRGAAHGIAGTRRLSVSELLGRRPFL